MPQLRHKQFTELDRPRELVIACPPMRSNINLSRIARAAGCWGITRMICCGTAKLIDKIARDSTGDLEIEVHRTLMPVLKRLREDGFYLVGLEQTDSSESIFEYQFPRRTALVIGNERHGIDEEILAMMDVTVEIPVYGLPYSHNAATATVMAIYEYCRQFPSG
jgi:tRNA G18 (ribose-2'-O)-methylase SpoU